MDDASGRFTNGFFWGNSYFTGSATECDYIGKVFTRKNSKIDVESSIEEVREFNAEPRKRVNLGFSGTNTWIQTTSIDTSPYRLGFYMLRFSINASQYTTVSNINTVGFIQKQHINTFATRGLKTKFLIKYLYNF